MSFTYLNCRRSYQHLRNLLATSIDPAMKKVTCVIFIFAFLFPSSLENDFAELEPFKQGLEDFLSTGEASDEFLKYLDAHQFPHVLREGGEELYDNPTVCSLCNLVVDLIMGVRMLGISRETVVKAADLLCTRLNIESERVCKGVIGLNVDVFLYIFDSFPDFTSNRLCGSILQNFNCPTGDAFEWSVNIPSGNSPERAKPNETEAQSFKILQLSDIHYDPDYTPNGNANCGEPICCQSDQGEPATPEDACGYWTDYRDADTPWHLVEETVKQANFEDFDYVYYTGDIISHKIWETSVEKNTDAITKLYTFFKDNFEVPVFPVFGNHEPHPLNLWPADDVDEKFSMQWLFELAAQQWSDLIGQDVSDTVLKGGYYSVSPRPGFRVIGINSNVGYTDNWWLLHKDVDPYNQLQWLADTLKEAEDNNESVHILSHVPTGGASSLKVWFREYSRIVERFANTITGHFNGHTHKDEFHVFYNSTDSTQAINVAFNGASVTPFSSSNPSFKYYEVDDTIFSLLDYEEWTFNLTLANSFGETDSVEWYKLYSFVDSYGAKNLLPVEVDQVLQKMAQEHSLLDDYFKYKFRNGDAGIRGGCDDSCKKSLLCNIVQTLYGDNDECNRFLSLYDQ